KGGKCDHRASAQRGIAGGQGKFPNAVPLVSSSDKTWRTIFNCGRDGSRDRTRASGQGDCETGSAIKSNGSKAGECVLYRACPEASGGGTPASPPRFQRPIGAASEGTSVPELNTTR